uniref:Macrophage mannose receptor 1 n=1 Tax=Schistocephalus solidus TaxID=70667 RepID=A0A0V0JB89_SCHSO
MELLLRAFRLRLIIGFYCFLFVNAQNITTESPKLPFLINDKEIHCAAGFFRLGTSCFLLYNGTNRGFTWDEARRECKGLAPVADLARITNQTYQDYFTALLPFVSQSAWIGLRMRSNASDWTNAVGVYEWVSTSNRTHQAAQQEPDFGFSNWAASRYLDVGGHPGDIQDDENGDAGSQLCVFLSSGGGLQTGQWVTSSCRLRMGFLCEQTVTALMTTQLPVPAAASLQLLVTPPAHLSPCLPGFFLFLGTCYRLLSMVPTLHAEAAQTCQNHTSPIAVTLVLPRSPVHLAFLRFLLTSRLSNHEDINGTAMINDRRAWISVTASVNESKILRTDNAHLTPWLTHLLTATVAQHPHRQPQHQLDAVCFQISTLPEAPLISSPCAISQGYPGALPLCSHEAMESEVEAGRRETAASLCQSLSDADNARWIEFQDACYTVLPVTGSTAATAVTASEASLPVANISSLCESLVPAGTLTSILSVEEQAFIAQLSDRFDSDLWIGGYIKPKRSGHVYWFDGSPDNGFSRLQPGLYQDKIAGNNHGFKDVGQEEKSCLVLQKVSGWWVERSCDGDGQSPPPMAVCKIRLPVTSSTSTNDTLFPPMSASEDVGTKDVDNRLTCPDGFWPGEADIFSGLEETLSRPKTCYRIFVAGPRAQVHNWEAAEKHCDGLVEATNRSWTGHLASLPDPETSRMVLRSVKAWGVSVATDEPDQSTQLLPARLIKTSDLAWIGLSASYTSQEVIWNNWTDGSHGEATFYAGKLQESFATEADDFFDYGHCIAVHLPTGLWYSLRCSLDIGHLCQAQLKTASDNDDPNNVLKPPGCLNTISLASPAVPVDASGFVRDPEVDCGAEDFKYFNKQCYRAIDDRFLSFAEAHAYCKNLAPPSVTSTAGLAVLHSYEDHMFVASLLSELPMLPPNNSRYGKLPSISRLEVAWRRYHWLGLFNYRHGSHTVDESAACYVPHEVSTDLHNSPDGLPTCFVISGSPEVSNFARLSADFDCGEKLPFVCSFRPDDRVAVKKVKQNRSLCPENYAVYRSARGVNCYRFASSWLASYEEANQLCTGQSQTAERGRLAALLSPYHVAWLRAHLPSPTRGGINNWWLQPHWIGLRLPGSPLPSTTSWQWQRSGSDESADFPVTHTEWSSVPTFSANNSLAASDICFAFANSPDFNSTELDMVPLDCDRNLSPLCEADSLEEVEVEVSIPKNTRFCSSEANQEDYNGFANTTVSGKSCLRWDLITDTAEVSILKEAFHATSLRAVASVIDGRITLSASDRLKSPAYLPALSAASNWCRNPNGLRETVFCYVLDASNLTWEYCSVPLCKDFYDNHGSGQPSVFPTSSNQTRMLSVQAPISTGRTLLYLFIFVCTTFLVGGLLCFVYKKRSTISAFRLFPVGVRVPNIFPRARFHSSSSLCLLNDNVTFQNTPETV